MRTILSSPITAVLLIVIAVILVVGLAKNLQSLDGKNELAASLDARLQDAAQESAALQHDIEALSTEEALESEARSRLNLKKEGEEVVVIIPKEGEAYTPPSDEEFLAAWEQRKRPGEPQRRQEEFRAVEWVRSILSGILKGREEVIE